MSRVSWVVIDDHGDDADASDLPRADRVVCADSGVALARHLGLDVDVVVGDLDSVTEQDLAAVVAAGAQVQEHPAAKAQTDLELSLAVAAQDADTVIVLGGSGGRIDHALANVTAIASDALAHVRVHARLGAADMHVVRDELTLELPPDTTVTLLPSGGDVRGITTDGLLYPLADDDLAAWAVRGVSNVVTGSPVRITVTSGCLLVVVPRTTEQDHR